MRQRKRETNQNCIVTFVPLQPTRTKNQKHDFHMFVILLIRLLGTNVAKTRTNVVIVVHISVM